jgi:hypothetical protein
VPNAPFRFLDKVEALARLRKALARVGLTGEEPVTDEILEADPSHPVRLRFTCPWLVDVMELHWHYAWWDDGMKSELARIEIVFRGATYDVIDVARLLGERLPRPLAEVLTGQIATCCSLLTGKPG